MSVSVQRLPFTASQLAILIAYGAILWFLAALVCRFAGTVGWFEGANRAILYVAVIPGTLPFVLLQRRLAQLANNQMALGTTIATTTALILDGLALAWYPQLYGPGAAQTAASGAVILWGAGVAIILGCWFNRAPPQ